MLLIEETCIIRHFSRFQQMFDYAGYSIIQQFGNAIVKN